MGVKEYRIVWSDEDHARIKAAAVKAGITLKKLIERAINAEVERINMEQGEK